MGLQAVSSRGGPKPRQQKASPREPLVRCPGFEGPSVAGKNAGQLVAPDCGDSAKLGLATPEKASNLKVRLHGLII